MSTKLLLFIRRSFRLYTLYVAHVGNSVANRTKIYFKLYALMGDLDTRSVGRFAF